MVRPCRPAVCTIPRANFGAQRNSTKVEHRKWRELENRCYAHMRIRVSGHEKNHKPTREERVRHHPKKMFPTVPMGIRVWLRVKEITA
jgi:hypothetical protein